MSDGTTPMAGTNLKSDRWLLLYLRFIGWVSLLAFAAAIMPEPWMIQIAKVLTIDPFPVHPLTFYLARNLSLLYGFVGVALIVVAHDIDRYRPAVRLTAYGTMAFGVLQVLCDCQSSMPWWWSWGEGVSTVFGGAAMFYLDARSRKEIKNNSSLQR